MNTCEFQIIKDIAVLCSIYFSVNKDAKKRLK